MHYFAAVVIPDRETANEAIEKLMEPYSEHSHDDGKWDWWVIGGRWTGVWSGYDPTEDPANWETCFLCQGTGIRNDELGRQHREKNPEYTCNGCGYRDGEPTARPAGMRVEHASRWVSHEGDIIPIADAIAHQRTPHALITANGWLESETWDDPNGRFVETPDWEQVYRNELAKHEGQYVAVVDYHS